MNGSEFVLVYFSLLGVACGAACPFLLRHHHDGLALVTLLLAGTCFMLWMVLITLFVVVNVAA